MKGPGQLLGPFDVNTRGRSDVWSNDISDVAIRARQQEDADEAAAWEATKVAKGWTNGLPPNASDVDKSDFAIGTRREQARNARVYEGSLTKRGDGTLFLTGNDSWHGTSTVLRREAFGRGFARELDRRTRRDARRQRQRGRQHRRRRRRAAARSRTRGSGGHLRRPGQCPDRRREREHRQGRSPRGDHQG